MRAAVSPRGGAAGVNVSTVVSQRRFFMRFKPAIIPVIRSLLLQSAVPPASPRVPYSASSRLGRRVLQLAVLLAATGLNFGCADDVSSSGSAGDTGTAGGTGSMSSATSATSATSSADSSGGCPPSKPCTEAANCCEGLENFVLPGASCPSNVYPYNWSCVGGYCQHGGCSSDADCSDLMPGLTCLGVGGVGQCVVTCDAMGFDCAADGGMPGTTCSGLDDSQQHQFCRQPP